MLPVGNKITQSICFHSYGEHTQIHVEVYKAMHFKVHSSYFLCKKCFFVFLFSLIISYSQIVVSFTSKEVCFYDIMPNKDSRCKYKLQVTFIKLQLFS